MAEGSAGGLCRGHATICLPVGEEEYDSIAKDPRRFRQWLDGCHARMPELFPEGFSEGYRMKDQRYSRKQKVVCRRIVLRDGRSYSVRPSFVMPYMAARVDEAEAPLFLRKFGVPFWALAHVFGDDPMYWYRCFVSLSEYSLVGTSHYGSIPLPSNILAGMFNLCLIAASSPVCSWPPGNCHSSCTGLPADSASSRTPYRYNSCPLLSASHSPLAGSRTRHLACRPKVRLRLKISFSCFFLPKCAVHTS